MPELQWDEFDFFYCLEVEPQIEEYKTRYGYEVRRDDLVLELTVWPIESVVALTLRPAHSEICLITFALFVHGKVTHTNDKRGEYLRFENCLITPFPYLNEEYERVWEAVKPRWSVELSVKPQIQIRYLD